jgi:glycosyltransferase involved in cell wall biosynthesis
VSQDVPLALTLHDLSWVQRPQDFTAYERAWHRLARPERLAHRAAIVVAVSGATRDEAVAAWALDPAQVAVVHSGVDRPGRQAPGAAARRPRPYLLFVGALEPRKAPDVLVRAFARARARGLDADLLLAGEGRLGSALSGPGVHVLGPVSAGRRDELYAGALAVVLPSYLEGFGFPPLEGLAAGVPAVVSDLPVFRELLGAAALRVAPGDEAGLADALLRIAADERLRAELVDAGRPTVVGLTWERAARATRAALARAAGIEA